MAPERLPAKPRPLEPEVVPRGSPDPWVEKLAWVMDRSIPIGGGRRIGLDPIIGLLPGLGDVIGARDPGRRDRPAGEAALLAVARGAGDSSAFDLGTTNAWCDLGMTNAWCDLAMTKE